MLNINRTLTVLCMLLCAGGLASGQAQDGVSEPRPVCVVAQALDNHLCVFPMFQEPADGVITDNRITLGLSVLSAWGRAPVALSPSNFLGEAAGMETPAIALEPMPDVRPLSVLLLLDVTDTMVDQDRDGRPDLIHQQLPDLVDNLVNRFAGVQLGVMAFSDRIVNQFAFSADYEAAKAFLSDLTIDRVPINSNVLIAGVDAAVREIPGEASRDYVILTVTDAAYSDPNTQPGLPGIVERAGSVGVPVYTIALPTVTTRPGIAIPVLFAQQTGGFVYAYPEDAPLNAQSSAAFMAESLASFSSALQSRYRLTLDVSPLRRGGVDGAVNLNLFAGYPPTDDLPVLSAALSYQAPQYGVSFTTPDAAAPLTGVVELGVTVEPPGSYRYEFWIGREQLTCADPGAPVCLWDTTTGYAPGLQVAEVYVYSGLAEPIAPPARQRLNIYSANLDVQPPNPITGQAEFVVNTGNFNADMAVLYADFGDGQFVEVARAPRSAGQTLLRWDVNASRPADVQPGETGMARLRLDLRDISANLLIARWESVEALTVRYPQAYTFTVEGSLPQVSAEVASDSRPLNGLYTITAHVDQPLDGDLGDRLAVIIAQGNAERGYNLVMVLGETTEQTITKELDTGILERPGRYAVGPAIVRGAGQDYQIIDFDPSQVDVYRGLQLVQLDGRSADSVSVVSGVMNLTFPTSGVVLEDSTLQVYAVGGTRQLLARVPVNAGDEVRLPIDLDNTLFEDGDFTERTVNLLAEVRSLNNVLLARWQSGSLRALPTPDYELQTDGFVGPDGLAATALSGAYVLDISLNNVLLAELGDELRLASVTERGEYQLLPLELARVDDLNYRAAIDTNALTLLPGVYDLRALIQRDDQLLAESKPLIVTIFRTLQNVTLTGVQGDAASGVLGVDASAAGIPGVSALVLYANGQEIARQPAGQPVQINLDEQFFADATRAESPLNLQLDLVNETGAVMARWRSPELRAIPTPPYTVTLRGIPSDANGLGMIRISNQTALDLTAEVDAELLAATNDQLAIVFISDQEDGSRRVVPVSARTTSTQLNHTLDMSAAPVGVYQIAGAVVRGDELRVVELSEPQTVNFYQQLSTIQISSLRENLYATGAVQISVSAAGLPDASFAVFRAGGVELGRQTLTSDRTAILEWDVESQYFIGADKAEREVVVEVDVLDTSGTVLLASGSRTVVAAPRRQYTLSVAAAANGQPFDMAGFPDVTEPLQVSAQVSPQPPDSQPLVYGFFLSGDGGQNFTPLVVDESGSVSLTPAQFSPGAYVLQVTANLGTEPVGQIRHNLRLIDENNRLSPSGIPVSGTLLGTPTIEVDNFTNVAQIVAEFQPEGDSAWRTLSEYTPSGEATTPIALPLQQSFFANGGQEPVAGTLRITLNDAEGFPLYRWQQAVTVARDDSVPWYMFVLVLAVGTPMVFFLGRAVWRNLYDQIVYGDNERTQMGDGTLVVMRPNGSYVSEKLMASTTGKYLTVGRDVKPSLLIRRPDIAFPKDDAKDVSLKMGRIVVKQGMTYFIAEKPVADNILYNAYSLTESPEYDKAKRAVPMRIGDRLGFGQDGRWKLCVMEIDEAQKLPGAPKPSKANEGG